MQEDRGQQRPLCQTFHFPQLLRCHGTVLICPGAPIIHLESSLSLSCDLITAPTSLRMALTASRRDHNEIMAELWHKGLGAQNSLAQVDFSLNGYKNTANANTCQMRINSIFALMCSCSCEALFRQALASKLRSNLVLSTQLDSDEDVEPSQSWTKEMEQYICLNNEKSFSLKCG